MGHEPAGADVDHPLDVAALLSRQVPDQEQRQAAAERLSDGSGAGLRDHDVAGAHPLAACRRRSRARAPSRPAPVRKPASAARARWLRPQMTTRSRSMLLAGDRPRVAHEAAGSVGAAADEDDEAARTQTEMSPQGARCPAGSLGRSVNRRSTASPMSWQRDAGMPARRQRSKPPGDGTTTASTSGHAQAAWMSTRSVMTVITGMRRAWPAHRAHADVIEQRMERHDAVGVEAIGSRRSPPSVTERSTVRSSMVTAGAAVGRVIQAAPEPARVPGDRSVEAGRTADDPSASRRLNGSRMVISNSPGAVSAIWRSTAMAAAR